MADQDNRAVAMVAGVGLLGAAGAVWYFSRKKQATQSPIVTGYLARITAATTRTELEAVRGLIFPYIEPIVYPTSYLATGFEVDFFKGTLSRAQYDTLFTAYLAKLDTLPAFIQPAAASARQSVRRVTIPSGAF